MTKSSDISASPAGLLLAPLATTGIGSLPMRELRPALESAFAVDVPYFSTLPQLCLQGGMLQQGLFGFPGVFWKGDELRFEFRAWERGREAWEERLASAGARQMEFPFDSTDWIWQATLDRLRTHPSPLAKAQWVGPVTATRALRGLETVDLGPRLEVVASLGEWLLVKALAMGAALRNIGKEMLFFFDEPGLGTEADSDACRYAAGQLRDRLAQLQNFGYLAGVHCCANFDAEAWLLGSAGVLSFDASLLLPRILANPAALRAWHARGGRLALGAVPTRLPAAWNSVREVEQCWTSFAAALGEGDARRILGSSFLTPACGLGLRTVAEAEQVFFALKDFQEKMLEKLS